jgi:hypothetical protein
MSIDKKERIEKLCSKFSLLDETDQEYILGILQALLFVKKKLNEPGNEFLSGTKKNEPPRPSRRAANQK